MRLSPGTAVGSPPRAAGGAYAAIPSAGGTINGCYATTNGLLLGIPHCKGDLRAVDSGEACRSYERAVSWSQHGPQGATGPQVVKGDTGATGPAGSAGPGPVAFGRVNADGTIDAANSVGLDTATFSRASGSSTTSPLGARWSTSICSQSAGAPRHLRLVEGLRAVDHDRDGKAAGSFTSVPANPRRTYRPPPPLATG